MNKFYFSCKAVFIIILLSICVGNITAGTGDFNAWDMSTTRPGDTDGIACGPLSFTESDITIELWLYITTSNFNSGVTIASTRFDGAKGFSLDVSTDGRLRGFFRNDYGDILNGRSDYVFPFFFEKADIVDKWVHIAIVFSSTNNVSRSYLNGEIYQDLVKSTDPYVPYEIGWIGNHTGAMRMGYWYTASAKFYGKIADFRIWSVGRTDAEIKANYNKNLTGTYESNPGLYLNYRFFTYERGFINDANPTVTTNKGWCNPSTDWNIYYTRSVLAYRPYQPEFSDNILTWTTPGSLTNNTWDVELTNSISGVIDTFSNLSSGSLALESLSNCDYSVKVRTKNTEFYSDWSTAQTFTVNKPATTISPVVGSYTYTGTSQGPNTANVTGSQGTITYLYESTDGITYPANATPPSEIGDYFVTASVAADANYNSAISSATSFSIYPVVSTFSKNGTSNWSSTTDWTYSPVATTDLVLSSGELIIDQNPTVNSITIQPGAKLTLNNGKTLTTGTITLQSTVAGTATFVDKNSTETLTDISATVQQYLPETDRNWYVGSPITSTSYNVLNTGNSVVEYSEELASWLTVSGNLIPMKGYISVAGSTGTGIVNFAGNLNTGTKSITLSRKGSVKSGFNLVSNPYPSYLMWTESLANSANCLSTIWYRTKTDGNYLFQTYNASGDLGVPLSTSGYIPPMQAFWVRTTVDGSTLSVDNSMRSHGNGTTNLLRTPANNPNKLVRLQISNGTVSDETIIYFNENAQNTFDAYDSPKMSNNNVLIPEIFTLAGTEKLVINGMKSIPENEEIPLGFTLGNSTNFNLKAIEVRNFTNEIQILLKDNVTGNILDLSEGNTYSFDNSLPSDERFSIIFKTIKITTDLISEYQNGSDVLVYMNKNNQIIFSCSDINNNSHASLYDILGHKLSDIQLENKESVFDIELIPGIYFVRIQSGDRNTIKKVIIKQ